MVKVDPRSFAAVIHDYIASDKFKRLTPGTQAGYRVYLRLAERPNSLGGLPAAALTTPLVQVFLDNFADRPGAQAVACCAIKAVEKWALPRGRLPYPITIGVEKIESGGDGHRPWIDAQIACGEAFAPPYIARIITLGANTGQRGSDLCRMCWTDIETVEGRSGINVTQRKTGLKIWIPMTQALQAAIETWKREPGPFLRRPDNTPWKNRNQMASSWIRERDRNPQLAPCAGLVLHGLRASAAIRLRRAGVPPLLIGDMIGMSRQTIERYCRFADQRVNALAAVHYLDVPEHGTERVQNKNFK